MKKLIALLIAATMPMLACAELGIRTLTKTNDILQTKTKEQIAWFQGEKVQRDLWVRSGTNVVSIPAQAFPIMYATDATLTNYYIWITGQVANVDSGLLRFVIPQTQSALPDAIYEASAIVYDGSPTGQPPTLVAQRFQIKVNFAHDYHGVYTGPISDLTNYPLDASTVVFPTFWTQQSTSILATLGIDAAAFNALSTNNVLTSNAFVAADSAAGVLRIAESAALSNSIAITSNHFASALASEIASRIGADASLSNLIAITSNAYVAAVASEGALRIGADAALTSTVIKIKSDLSVVSNLAVNALAGQYGLMVSNETGRIMIDKLWSDVAPSIWFMNATGTQATTSSEPIRLLAADGELVVEDPLRSWFAYRIWHAGNDGPGSGLEADSLDGRDWNNAPTIIVTDPNTNAILILSATGGLQVGSASFHADLSGNIYQDSTNTANLGFISGDGSGVSNVNAAALGGFAAAHFATGAPLYSASGFATGSPVYVESDPRWQSGTSAIWSAISARSTGTPVYVESDPVYVAAFSGLLTKVAAASTYSTGTPVYVEVDPTFSATLTGLLTKVGAASIYATGTPKYVESDPIWSAASTGYLTKVAAAALYPTGTPLYVEADAAAISLLASASNALRLALGLEITNRTAGDAASTAVALGVGAGATSLVNSISTTANVLRVGGSMSGGLTNSSARGFVGNGVNLTNVEASTFGGQTSPWWNDASNLTNAPWASSALVAGIQTTSSLALGIAKLPTDAVARVVGNWSSQQVVVVSGAASTAATVAASAFLSATNALELARQATNSAATSAAAVVGLGVFATNVAADLTLASNSFASAITNLEADLATASNALTIAWTNEAQVRIDADAALTAAVAAVAADLLASSNSLAAEIAAEIVLRDGSDAALTSALLVAQADYSNLFANVDAVTVDGYDAADFTALLAFQSWQTNVMRRVFSYPTNGQTIGTFNGVAYTNVAGTNFIAFYFENARGFGTGGWIEVTGALK
jgi:hypothetical protein